MSFNGTLSSDKENHLEVSFYYNGNPLYNNGDYHFGNAPITFQQTSSATDPEGNEFYPVYDVRDANELNNKIIPLTEVPAGNYDQWDPYASGVLDIGSRLLADFNDNGKVDNIDYALFADGWGDNSLENHIANISGPNGIPDFNSVSGNAIIDGYDLSRFSEGWLRDANDPNTW